MAATLLSEGQPRWRRVGWHGLASVVAASRVHVGIHHPSDVVAGALIGTGLGHLVRRYWRAELADGTPSAVRLVLSERL
jgi:membrane-associated phospholipid phosphatase